MKRKQHYMSLDLCLSMCNIYKCTYTFTNGLKLPWIFVTAKCRMCLPGFAGLMNEERHRLWRTDKSLPESFLLKKTLGLSA